ncbi:MFS transporter [Metaplanococcus flavidus]
MNHTKPKLWTKEFILISTVNFFLTLVFFLLIVTIAVYAVAEYGATTSQAGLVTGIAIIGTMTGRIIIGRLIENIGRKRTLVIGLILFVLTTLLYFVNLNLSFLLMNRFLHGMTLGMASTAAGTIVAQIIPMTRKGEGIGYFSMSSTLATAIGPFIGLYMSQHTSFDMIFTLCVAFGLVSLSFALFTKVPPVDYSGKTGQARGFKLSDFLEPKALPIALITLTSALCFSSILSFINFYAIEIALVETASFFFVVYAIAVLLSRPFTGRLMDIRGANFVMYPAFVFLAAGLLLLSTASSSVIFLLSAILIGLGFGNLQSTIQAIAVKLTPPHRMGLATSTFFIFLDAGLGFGPYILGFIIPLTGFSSLYAILGFTALAASLLYYVLHGRKERSELATARTS